MKTKEIILGIGLTLLLSGAGAFAQSPLSPEKKKELRKFDPADIVSEVSVEEPKARESQVGRGGTQSRREARTPASAAPISAAVDSTVTIPPAALASKSPTSRRAIPSPAPKGGVVLTQLAAPRSQSQSSEQAATGAPAPATVVKRSASSVRFSLPVIFLLIGLILLALVAVTAKLRKELRNL